MRQLSAVRTSPSWLMVMGREVGTVTFMAVPAGSPPELPSVVELRLTGVVPEPPLAVMLLSAQALTARAKAYRRGAGAAAGRDVVVRAGADGKGKDKAEGEDEGSGLFELFHVGISPFE